MKKGNEDVMHLKVHFDYDESVQERNTQTPDCEAVYAHGSLYKEVFGRTLKGTDRKRRFVKITAVPTKRAVWRTLYGVPKNVKSTGILYLNSDAKNILEEGNEESRVRITPSSWFSYYWHTANSATRIAFRVGIVSGGIGVVSLLVGIASLILAIISLC